MAEDIRDMSIMGMVYEFKNQAAADAYILRNGVELTDKEEMFSVGGYTRVFSLEHNEPALGIRIIDKDEADASDKSELFYYDEASSRWLDVETIKEDMKIAKVMDKLFLSAVDSHWQGDKYSIEAYTFGPTLVFRNGIDGPMIEPATKGDVMVRRVRKDGGIRYYWPKGSKMIQG